MKKTIILFTTTALVVITMSSGVMDVDGKAGATKAPGESSCYQSGCHISFQENTGNGSVKITCADMMPNWRYTPGQTYNITVTVAKTGAKLFGMGFEALTSAGANAGTLKAGTGTVLKSVTVGGNRRTNVTHTTNGGKTNDSHDFVFTWVAPATDVGKVTFYCAGNAANGDGTDSGDYIYTTSQEISVSPVGIADQIAFSNQISLYPNPAIEYLQIANVEAGTVMNVSIMDMKGAVISNQQNVTSNSRIELNELSSGAYLLKVAAAGKVAVKQFIKQ